jgi:phosphatidylinositol glycan class B
LSFLFRYQNAFLMVGWLAWLLFINKSKFNHLLLTALGILMMFVLGIFIDKWFYGEWVLSTWKYFEQNILLDKMSGFGIEPWYYYLVQIFNVGIPPFSLLYIVPFVLLMVYRWKDALVWTILPFVLIHFYIGHKELRFLFPAIGLLPLVAVTAGEMVNDKWPGFFKNTIVKVFVLLFWVQNALFTVIVSLKAADAQVALYKELYNRYEEPVVVYYIKDNPYCRALDVYYYKRPNLSVREIQTLDEIKLLPDTTVLFATVKNEEGVVLEKNNEKIFSALPDWIKVFNVSNWVERTRFWKVYEIKNKPLIKQ